MRARLTRAAPRGMSLIELLVAVAILALATTALWRSIGVAARGIGGQEARVLAQEAVLNRAAERRLVRRDPRLFEAGALPSRVVLAGQAFDLSEEALPPDPALAPLEGWRIEALAERGGAGRIEIWLAPARSDEAAP